MGVPDRTRESSQDRVVGNVIQLGSSEASVDYRHWVVTSGCQSGVVVSWVHSLSRTREHHELMILVG
jgi:hypothetical protein